MLNGVGDLFDIIPACDKEKQIRWLDLRQEEAEALHQKQGHCSGLIKVTGDMSDLFLAHSSWFTYSNTDRIFKHYNFQFKDVSTSSRKISFSSYPGFLESLDDFYLLESGLTWTQTSNGVINQTIYEHVQPESLLAWQRVRIASAMASDGEEWFQIFSRNHSGTYANQYMSTYAFLRRLVFTLTNFLSPSPLSTRSSRKHELVRTEYSTKKWYFVGRGGSPRLSGGKRYDRSNPNGLLG